MWHASIVKRWKSIEIITEICLLLSDDIQVVHPTSIFASHLFFVFNSEAQKRAARQSTWVESFSKPMDIACV